MSPCPHGWSVRGRQLAWIVPSSWASSTSPPTAFSDGGRFVRPRRRREHAGRPSGRGRGHHRHRRRVDSARAHRRYRLRRSWPACVPVDRAPGSRHRVRFSRSIPSKSDVARAALDAGAHIVNDVSALRLDAGIAEACAADGGGAGAHALARRRVRHGQLRAREVRRTSWEKYVTELAERGACRGESWRSPGLHRAGSGHRLRQENASIRSQCSGAAAAGRVGSSRPGGRVPQAVHWRHHWRSRARPDRLSGTLGAAVAALALGARIFRVHDVRPARQALDVAWASSVRDRPSFARL